MRKIAPRTQSLVVRLLIAQGVPLAVFTAALLAIGAWTAHSIVERTADRLLAGTLQTIRESVTVRDGRLTADVAPWSLALLDGPERDAVFYSLRDGDELVTGYEELPNLSDAHSQAPVFADMTVRGVPVRMAQQTLVIPGRERPVVVSVAQSLDSRRAGQHELYRSLLFLPALLVVLAALLIWPALQWGLNSLNRLIEDLSLRASGQTVSFAPVPAELAPPELSPVIGAFNRLLAGMEKSTAGIERFSADASHQLRTPLSVLAANLDLLAASKRPWTATERRLIADSQQAAADMARLIQQLLSTARANGQIQNGGADVRRAVRRGALTAAAAHGVGAAGLRLRMPHEDVLVAGDEALISEQINNLVDNALRYGAAPVFVSIGLLDRNTVVTVWDHGPGTSPDDLERLTERFYRPARNDAPGSGLGLSIVEALAEAQGARLTLANRRRRPGLVATLRYRPA